MATTFHKKLFEVQLLHELAPAKLCTAFGLVPTKQCAQLLKDHKMEWRNTPGKITVFYSGDLVDDGPPPKKKILPKPAILPNDTELLFIVTLLDRSIIYKTTIPPYSALTVTDKNKAIPYPFIKTSVLSIRFPQTAGTKAFEVFKVSNHKNILVYESLVKKDEDGFYNCSADLSLHPPGVFSFTLQSDNSTTRKYYVDTLSETAGQYGFIRIVKDATWLLPDKIVPAPTTPDYNIFSYTFEKA